MQSDYSFGDSSRASERLGLLARVFDAPSRAFLTEAGLVGCELALDLGCGPGHTTRLIAEVLGCRRVVGLDSSPTFVVEAERANEDRLAFRVHDVTRVPFPTGPADLVYARLLCSHLRDPARAVRDWLESLRPGGRLLLDDVEWIRSAAPAFRRYLDLVEWLLASRGHCLGVGERLDEAAREAGLALVSNRVRVHRVDPRDAAALFSLNLAELRQNEAVSARLGEAALDALAEELSALREGGGPEITWGLRQLALEAET
jgi:SAM-dependent methyltransferase